MQGYYDDEGLAEEIIKKTHGLLARQIDTEQGTS